MEWKMPDLGEGVQEGEIVKWLIKEGDRVSMDQHLVEIMTDKATMEIPSSIEGVVQKIVLREGKIAKIGETLAVIGEGGEFAAQKTEVRKQKTETERSVVETPRSAKGALASPAIRQLARELNVDLEKIVGTGPGGRGRRGVRDPCQRRGLGRQAGRVYCVERGCGTVYPRRGQRMEIPACRTLCDRISCPDEGTTRCSNIPRG